MSVAVLFDLDGTLIDLDVDIDKARERLAELFRPLGVNSPFRPILQHIEQAAHDAEANGGCARELIRAGRALLDDSEIAAAKQTRTRPGARDLLDHLVARGIPLGLVTDNGRACVPLALLNGGISPGRFAIIVTRDDVLETKPSPAGILMAARFIGSHRQYWYVGDRLKDLEAGRAAAGRLPGLKVALIKGGPGAREHVENSDADFIAAKLSELVGVLAPR